LAESAKGMAAVTVPDKRQRRRRSAESTAVVKPAKGAARCSQCYIRRKVTLFVVPYLPLSHILAYLLTCSLTTSSLHYSSPSFNSLILLRPGAVTRPPRPRTATVSKANSIGWRWGWEARATRRVGTCPVLVRLCRRALAGRLDRRATPVPSPYYTHRHCTFIYVHLLL